MSLLFFLAAVVAIVATIMVITRANAIHALLYLVVSLLSVAFIFFLLGAPFVAALEVIIYAGAIMVLFVFVVMMLALGPETSEMERRLLNPRMWIGPAILSAVLVVELIYALAHGPVAMGGVSEVPPKSVGLALYGPYVLGVELASMLLLAGLVGTYHLGQDRRTERRTKDGA